jgi:CHAD domain-containing protein
MPKPIWIAGLSRRTPVGRAASKVLQAVLRDLLEKIPGAHGADSHEGIHDLRVAVKRFREAFRLFRPVLQKKVFRRHRDWIAKLNDALGEVRDRDVALIHLRKLAAAQMELPRSVAELVSRLEAERVKAAEGLATMVDLLQSEGVPAQLGASIDSIEQDAVSAQPTYEFACGRVRERLLDVRERWSAARRQATPESMHRVRIGNKRLRYAIEPFSRMLGKEVRRLYRSASRFHDVLGDLHDADSMVILLETSMASAPKAERRCWEGYLAKVIRARRVALRKVFVLADKLEPLWDAAQLNVERTPQ